MNKAIKAILIGVVSAVIASLVIKKFFNKNGQTPAGAA